MRSKSHHRLPSHHGLPCSAKGLWRKDERAGFLALVLPALRSLQHQPLLWHFRLPVTWTVVQTLDRTLLACMVFACLTDRRSMDLKRGKVSRERPVDYTNELGATRETRCSRKLQERGVLLLCRKVSLYSPCTRFCGSDAFERETESKYLIHARRCQTVHRCSGAARNTPVRA